MTRLPLNMFEQASQVCLVANTPPYLYKHLRRDALVKDIGTNWPTNDIFDQLSFYAKEGADTEEAYAALYVFLVALSFKPLVDYREFLMQFDPPARWIAELRGLILANATSNQILSASSAIGQSQRAISATGVNTLPKTIILGKK